MTERILQDDQQLGSSLRALLSGAVAEGAIMMAEATVGTDQHEHWRDVASRAVPYALARFDEAREMRDDEIDETDKVEIEPVDDGKRAKLDRLAALEAEAEQIRRELDS